MACGYCNNWTFKEHGKRERIGICRANPMQIEISDREVCSNFTHKQGYIGKTTEMDVYMDLYQDDSNQLRKARDKKRKLEKRNKFLNKEIRRLKDGKT